MLFMLYAFKQGSSAALNLPEAKLCASVCVYGKVMQLVATKFLLWQVTFQTISCCAIELVSVCLYAGSREQIWA